MNLKDTNMQNSYRKEIMDIFEASCLYPVFVVGAPRSGTTWVQSLISSHPDFYTIPETKLFQNVLEPRLHLTDAQLSPTRAKKIPERITPEQLAVSLLHIRRFNNVKVSMELEQVIERYSREGVLDPCSFLNLLMYNSPENVPDAAGRRWVEKTPRHVFFLKSVFKYFPKAKVVYVNRNPVDVAVSSFLTFGNPLFEGLLESYLSHKAYRNFIRSSPQWRDNVLEVKYEDLSRDISQLQGVFEFLGAKTVPLDRLPSVREQYQKIYKGTSFKNIQSKMEGTRTEEANESKKLKEKVRLLLDGYGFWKMFDADYADSAAGVSLPCRIEKAGRSFPFFLHELAVMMFHRVKYRFIKNIYIYTLNFRSTFAGRSSENQKNTKAG